MTKINERMEAGTDAATVTDVQVTTSSQTIAKPIVSRSVNHKFIELRQHYYHGADCYVFETICGFCKKNVGGWSEKQANDNWEKHFC